MTAGNLNDCLPATGVGTTSVTYYSAYPQRIQEKVVSGSYSLVLTAPPKAGDILIAQGHNSAGLPTVNTGAGWALIQSHTRTSTSDPYMVLAWKLAAVGETQAQTPFTGSPTHGGVSMIEVANIDTAFVASKEQLAFAISANSGTATAATTLSTQNDHDLAVAFCAYWGTGSAEPLTLASGGWLNTASDAAAGATSELIASQQVIPKSTLITASVSTGLTDYGLGVALLILKPNPALLVTQQVTNLTINVNGVLIEAGVGVPTAVRPNGSLYVRTDVSQLWRYTEDGGGATVQAINVAGTAQNGAGNTVTLSGYSTTQTLTFTKPLAANSGGLLTWDATSPWPTDTYTGPLTLPPVSTQTWLNTMAIYGNNGGADTLLFQAVQDGNLYATAALSQAQIALQMPQSFTGYTTYKVTGCGDSNPGDNRGGLSLLVAATSAGWTLMSDFTVVKANGVALSDAPRSINFVGDAVTAATDGHHSHTVTISAEPPASTAETNTGTATNRALTPRGFSASNFGRRIVQIQVTDPTSAGSTLVTGNGQAYFVVPAELAGMNLVAVNATVITVSSSGLPTVQLTRVRAGATASMLSTACSIDASETSSTTAATPPVINAGNAGVTTDDWVRIDVTVAGTGAKGLNVTMEFAIP